LFYKVQISTYNKNTFTLIRVLTNALVRPGTNLPDIREITLIKQSTNRIILE